MISVKQKLVHILFFTLMLGMLVMPVTGAAAAQVSDSGPQYTTALRSWPGDMQFIQPECNGGSGSAGSCGGG
jgi:hypothetical protein